MKCTACHARFGANVRHAPMLTDAAWSLLADKHDNLCTKCFYARAEERDVHLTLAMLKPCPVNLFHRPHSWFDLFTRGIDDQPVDIEAWAEADRDPGVRATRTERHHESRHHKTGACRAEACLSQGK